MVNPPTPWPRPETPRAPLDPTASETLELWAGQPAWDLRSLEEFAADGGRPVGPPNRSEVGDPADGLVAIVDWALRLFRPILALFRPNDRGRFYELPPGLELRPLPPTITGHLRSSLPKAPPGGTGETRGGGLTFPFPINDPTLDPVQVLELNRRRDAARHESGGGWPT